MSIEEHSVVEETLHEAAVRIIMVVRPEIDENTAFEIADALFENLLLADVSEFNDYLIQVAQWQQRASEGWVEEWGTRQDDEPEFITPVIWDSFEQARDVAAEDSTGSTRVMVRRVKSWETVSFSDDSDI